MKWHLLTQRMRSDGRVDENSRMSSLSRDTLLAGMRWWVKSSGATLQPTRAQMSFFFTFWLLPCVRGRREQTQPWRKYRYKDYFNVSFLVTVCFFSLSSRFAVAYVTSLREFLSSLPKVRMYCHCSSDRLWPPM